MKVRYAVGTEWTNHRGQVFVCLPTHPHARKDGLVARSRLVMEQKIGRLLRPAERVWHVDEDPGNDEPDNLWLFPDQKELAQDRSVRGREGKWRGYSLITSYVDEAVHVSAEEREAEEREERRRAALRDAADRRRAR